MTEYTLARKDLGYDIAEWDALPAHWRNIYIRGLGLIGEAGGSVHAPPAEPEAPDDADAVLAGSQLGWKVRKV